MEKLFKVFPKKEHFNHISGRVWKNVKVLRWTNKQKDNSKWNVPYWMYPRDKFPFYSAGFG